MQGPRKSFSIPTKLYILSILCYRWSIAIFFKILFLVGPQITLVTKPSFFTKHVLYILEIQQFEVFVEILDTVLPVRYILFRNFLLLPLFRNSNIRLFYGILNKVNYISKKWLQSSTQKSSGLATMIRQNFNIESVRWRLVI